MNYDVISIGGATEDTAIHTDEGVIIDNQQDILKQKLVAFEYGAKLKVTRAMSTFGGGAANTAISMSRLGLKVASLLAVGDDERGERIVKNLKKEKVDTSLVQIYKKELSGFSPMIVCQDREHIVFSIRGANAKLRISRAVVSKIKNAKWFYVSSLSGETEDWLKTLENIFSIKNVKIAWNPGHLQLDQGKRVLANFLKRTYLLIINIDEARELVISDKQYATQDLAFFNNTNELLRVIKSWGPSIVVITEGRKGVSALDGKEFYQVTGSSNAQQVNTVGVGDSFGSSLVAGLEYYKGDLMKSMELGKKNASSVVAHEGAQIGLIYKKDIPKN